MNKSSNKKECIIETIDSMLMVKIDSKTKGKDILDEVFNYLEIFETHWFSIFYIDKMGSKRWLNPRKKLNLNNVTRLPMTNAHYKFSIRYFPESSEIELIQDIVKILFFKHEVYESTSNEFYDTLPENRALLAAAYACLVAHENKSLTPLQVIENSFNKLFPLHVMRKYDLTRENWIKIIEPIIEIASKQYYIETIQKSLSLQENEPMYGVTYYTIRNRMETKLLLGVDCYGLVICYPNSPLDPQIAFTWAEIAFVSFTGNKFVIKSANKKDPLLIFYAKSTKQNDEMLDLIIGNHENYLSRRQPGEALDLEIKLAMEAQKIQNKRKKQFEDKKVNEENYKNTAEAIKDYGTCPEELEKELKKKFEEASMTLKKNIDDTKKELEEIKSKKTDDSTIVEMNKYEIIEGEDHKLNKNLETNVNVVKKKEVEGLEKEISTLETELCALEISHNKNLDEIETIKVSNIEMPSSILPEKVLVKKRPITYAELKREQEKEYDKTLKKATQIFEAKTLRKDIDSKLRTFKADGQGKGDTLRNMISKNNTKFRIDQFEAL